MLVPAQKSKLCVAILGAGAWGTTLATLAAANGCSVRLWSRRYSQSLKAMLEGADIVLSAVSIKGVRTVITEIQSLPIFAETIFVTATKGLDPATTLTPSQIWQTAFPDHSVVVLSGPNLSKEIQQGLPAWLLLLALLRQHLRWCKRCFPLAGFEFIPILTHWG